MGGTNGSAPALGALLSEALAEEERRLAALEARLAALRQRPGAAAPASDSTQAIWAALAVPAAGAPAAPEPDLDAGLADPEPSASDHDDVEQQAADDADWAALSGADERAEGEDAERSTTARRADDVLAPPSSGASSGATARAVVADYEAAAAAVDDPRLEAARRLLAESGQGLQQLKACLSRAPAWEDPDDPTAPAAAPFWRADDDPRADDGRADEGVDPWADVARGDAAVADHEDDDDDRAPPPVPARERASGPRPRDVEAARFGLERAFRGDAPATDHVEPAWAGALRDEQARGLDALARVEELLVELGKTMAAVLERGAVLARPDLEERAARAERERDELRHVVAERSQRIARLEALVEQVLTSPGPAPAPPPRVPTLTPRATRRPPAEPPVLVQPAVTPRGVRRPAAPSEALRRSLLASPEASNAASRRALEALRPIAQAQADDADRARLRAALVQIGARHQQLVEEHAALLERLVKLLEA